MSTPLQAHETEWIKRTGLFPARLYANFAHRLGIKIPLAKPQYAVRGRVPTHVLPGATIMLSVESIESHPEHFEYRTWVCTSPYCQGKKWASKEELVADHPSEAVLSKSGEAHVYYCVLEIPPSEDGVRPAEVHLLTETP
jgi:hypothetical protein